MGKLQDARQDVRRSSEMGREAIESLIMAYEADGDELPAPRLHEFVVEATG